MSLERKTRAYIAAVEGGAVGDQQDARAGGEGGSCQGVVEIEAHGVIDI